MGLCKGVQLRPDRLIAGPAAPLQRRGHRLRQFRFPHACRPVENEGQGPGRGAFADVGAETERRRLHRPLLPQDPRPQLPDKAGEQRPHRLGSGGGLRPRGRGRLRCRKHRRGQLPHGAERPQAGGQQLVGIKAPHAAGKERAEHAVRAAVAHGGPPVEKIRPVLPAGKAQGRVPGRTARRQLAGRKLIAAARLTAEVHAAAKRLVKGRLRPAELSKFRFHGAPPVANHTRRGAALEKNFAKNRKSG